LTVGPSSTFQERSNDTFITGKIKASLLDQKDIFGNSFKVVTERGTVYLMGIATRRETDRATDVTRGVSGVQKVVRIVEIISESDLANMQSQQLQPGGTGAAPAPASSAPASRSNVPLPPMDPLPASPSSQPPASGVTTSPIR
jgi:hypothetical protein